MIKKIIFTIVFSAILSNSCFAGFEYNGTFSVNGNKEPQSYYILLNETNKIDFIIKDSSGETCKNIKVTGIKSSSGDLNLNNLDDDFKFFTVPTTGIYEVEVSLKDSITNDINYTLIINESSNDTSIKNINPVKAVDSVIDLQKENTTEVADNNTKKNSKFDLKPSDLEQIQEAETFFPSTVAEPLGPDSLATEDINNSEDIKNKTSQKIEKLNLNGVLTLKNSFDSFEFMSEKNRSWPKAVTFDKNQNLWILDGQLNKVRGYDTNFHLLKSFGEKGSDKSSFGMPVSLAVYNDKIIIGDRQKHCLHVFNLNGDWISSIESNRGSGLEIINPVSIIIRNNELWVADAGSNRLLCFDKDFKFLGSFGSSDESKIESIVSAATDGASIFILEEDGVIKKFGPMGNFESAVPTDISFASQLLVDVAGDFWIVDTDNNRFVCFSDEGKIKFEVNKEKIKDIDESHKLFSPTTISFGNNCLIAVADVGSKQIKIFELK